MMPTDTLTGDEQNIPV